MISLFLPLGCSQVKVTASAPGKIRTLRLELCSSVLTALSNLLLQVRAKGPTGPKPYHPVCFQTISQENCKHPTQVLETGSRTCEGGEWERSRTGLNDRYLDNRIRKSHRGMAHRCVERAWV